MPDITTMSFIIGALLVVAGIFGGGLEIKELKVPKLNNLSRILALIVGVAFLLPPIYLKAVNVHRPGQNPVPIAPGKVPVPPKPGKVPVSPPKNCPKPIWVYSTLPDSSIFVPERCVCKIRITCGFKSESQAQTGLSTRYFEVKLDGIDLQPVNKIKIVQDRKGGWHVYQDYLTGTLQKRSYQVKGITYEKHPDGVVDSRQFTIVSK